MSSNRRLTLKSLWFDVGIWKDATEEILLWYVASRCKVAEKYLENQILLRNFAGDIK